ncbi:MAG: hypothetical protein BWY26_00799 [Elusimicrobia bacterium ADurb.Bin231]|nr:MAG: hypothetical protein BWY26_00799 [Elusimicrobia bacterium ADurb.Bin231]
MKKKIKGQALVEFILSLCILPLFVGGIISISRVYIIKMKLHQAARHGAFLISTGKVAETTVRQEIKNYFDTGYPKVDMSKLGMKFKSVRVSFLKGDEVTVSYSLKIFDLGKLNFWKGTPVIEKTFTETVVCARQSIL